MKIRNFSCKGHGFRSGGGLAVGGRLHYPVSILNDKPVDLGGIKYEERYRTVTLSLMFLVVTFSIDIDYSFTYTHIPSSSKDFYGF